MFSAFFIRRPKFAMVISLAIMLAGWMCYNLLPVAEYPEVAPPSIVAFTSYPGASAQTIADTVAAPIEEQVNGVEGLIYYSSTSNNSGGYQLNLTFSPDTDPDMALVNVNNAVKRAERSLPNEVVMNGITVYKRSADFLGIIAFKSNNPDHTPLFLSNYVSRNIKDAVTRIPGVGQAIIFGELNYSMRVWLDPVRMNYYGISQDEVQAAIRGQNIQAATGSVGTESSSDYMQFKLEARGRLREDTEFKDIIIRSGEEGRLVRLADVADIELGAESYSGVPMVDGEPAVMLAVFKLSDGNAVEIMTKTKKLITEMELSFPEGLNWMMPYDSTKFVEETMHEIVMTLVMTFLLVMLITYLFLQDWRATIIPMVAIPVSLIGTFMFMQILGLSMNTLTMFGLILAIGSVVDDAIVVVECCMRLIDEEKMAPREAAFRAMNELTGALVAATLVVVAVYAPIAFYGGMIGIIYQQFAIAMCVALCLSLVVALTLSPALCALVLRETKAPKGFFKVFNTGLDFVRGRYLNVGNFLARRMALTVVLLGLILAGNYLLFTQYLPSAFLPTEDKGNLLGEVILPSGASLPRTEAVLKEYYTAVREIEGVEHVMYIPGMSMISGDGENLGMFIVSLKDWGERKTPETTIASIQQKVLIEGAKLTEASAQVFIPPAIMGLGATGGASFALQATGGQTTQEIAQATNLVLGKIMESRKALYAMTSFDATTPMVYLEIDRDKAEAMNVSIGSIFSTLQSQLGSMYVNDFNLYGKTYKVKIQAQGDYRESLNMVTQLTVPSRTGALVPIGVLASLDWMVGPRQVERFNMFPCATINAQSLPGVSSGQLMDTIEDIVRNELSNDYAISWTDMSYQEKQNEGQIVTMVILALMFAYLFLVAQYESWTTPVSVLLSVATGTLGSMFVLFYLGRALDIYCQLGLLMLVGLVAKTVILMVEYSKQLRDDGLPLIEASVAGMRVRFRAVLMTALSFVIGVSPLVIATGAGAGSRRSVGVTTFWGMIVATVIGVMIVPGLYVITRSMSEATKRFFRRAIVGDAPAVTEDPSTVVKAEVVQNEEGVSPSKKTSYDKSPPKED